MLPLSHSVFRAFRGGDRPRLWGSSGSSPCDGALIQGVHSIHLILAIPRASLGFPWAGGHRYSRLPSPKVC